MKTEFEVLWGISTLLEWVPETKQIFTLIWCEICGNEKCLFFCQLARVIAGGESCTCFWTAFVGYAFFPNRKIVSAHYKLECVCALGSFVKIERNAFRDENGKLLFFGSSCLMLFKEKTLQFMAIEVVCNWSHTAICQSPELRISAGINGQLLKSALKSGTRTGTI